MVSYEEKTYAAWLASAEVPYDMLIPLIHRMGSAEHIFDGFMKARDEIGGMFTEACRKRLTAAADPEKMSFFQQSLTEHRISALTILDEAYPHCLRQIPDPPGILFYQGDVSCLKHPRKAAMIGSRAASYAGQKAARKTAAELSRNGVCIISGLAYGIDTESHRGCLEGGSPTIAVMGCGLDYTYPAQNGPLKRDILLHGGLILSEYAPGMNPTGRHFPYRNRIISGLSEIVILMEARIRSGSMTTVSHALKQGKDVYAYPGDPISPLYEANRILLREGARYFSEAKDILSDMNWLDKNRHVGQNIVCSTKTVPGNDAEAAVYRALEKGDLGFDELAAATGMASSELLSTLTVLQIRGKIDLLPGKRYQIRNE